MKAAPDSTRILKWKDGKKAVFLLEFDDSAPTAVQNAIPELRKRGLTGTFYINPGNPPFKSLQKEWETEIPGPGIEYANHTYTHVGASSVPQLEQELEKCNAEIEKCYPDRKKPRLISFGQPGGVPWTVSRADTDAALAKFHLIERPPFLGYPFQLKTEEQVLALVDKALETGEMEHHDFHGVGGDWHITPMEIYRALLDKLVANRDQLWITDPISWHQYVTERTSAEISVLPSAQNQIRLKLSCKADPAFYDLPLSLVTKVPTNWKQCEVVQGTNKITVPVTNGEVTYSALPNSVEILLEDVGNK